MAAFRAAAIAALAAFLAFAPATIYIRRMVGVPFPSTAPWAVWVIAWLILIGPGVVMIARPTTRFSGRYYLVIAALCGGIVAGLGMVRV